MLSPGEELPYVHLSHVSCCRIHCNIVGLTNFFRLCLGYNEIMARYINRNFTPSDFISAPSPSWVLPSYRWYNARNNLVVGEQPTAFKTTCISLTSYLDQAQLIS